MKKSPESTLFALALASFAAFAPACGDDDNSSPPCAEPPAGDGGSGAESPAGDGGSGAESSGDGGSGTAGAGGQPVGDEDRDSDRDGVTARAGDCDDFNNTIYPGAEERNLDSIDSDCDGADAPPKTLVWSGEPGPDLVDAVALMDADGDGQISFDEFSAACAESAMLMGDARPGVVQVHASCAGTNSCRGMVYQTWNEIYDHSCRAVNGCAGWSCVETAEDQDRDGPASFAAAGCNHCHSGPEGTFTVQVPPGEDVSEFVADFWDRRSDLYLQSVIAFGIDGVASEGTAYSNMPGAYHLLSRAEMDGLIAHLRTLTPEGESFEQVPPADPIDPGN
ncbi:MopE-related protein [Sorangium sp. So ce321]|uniref:MopE-related protein n=1 Tax=Sorangium sp. So ce321 TaxID=3133300 RepID=UPI003F5F93A4